MEHFLLQVLDREVLDSLQLGWSCHQLLHHQANTGLHVAHGPHQQATDQIAQVLPVQAVCKAWQPAQDGVSQRRELQFVPRLHAVRPGVIGSRGGRSQWRPRGAQQARVLVHECGAARGKAAQRLLCGRQGARLGGEMAADDEVLERTVTASRRVLQQCMVAAGKAEQQSKVAQGCLFRKLGQIENRGPQAQDLGLRDGALRRSVKLFGRKSGEGLQDDRPLFVMPVNAAGARTGVQGEHEACTAQLRIGNVAELGGRRECARHIDWVADQRHQRMPLLDRSAPWRRRIVLDRRAAVDPGDVAVQRIQVGRPVFIVAPPVELQACSRFG